MNQILFGFISLLMLAITGVGFAEVKGQADARLAAEHQSQRVDAPENTPAPKTSTENTQKSALAEVTSKVADAIDDVTFGLSHDDGDEDEDDGYEREDTDRASARTSTPPTAAPVPQPAPTTPARTTSSAQTYTMAQVSAHNSAANCWSVISGTVYNLTSFVTQHPGGAAAIKSLCGVDGTTAYNGQHGGQGRPASELASLKVGTLVQ